MIALRQFALARAAARRCSRLLGGCTLAPEVLRESHGETGPRHEDEDPPSPHWTSGMMRTNELDEGNRTDTPARTVQRCCRHSTHSLNSWRTRDVSCVAIISAPCQPSLSACHPDWTGQRQTRTRVRRHCTSEPSPTQRGARLVDPCVIPALRSNTRGLQRVRDQEIYMVCAGVVGHSFSPVMHRELTSMMMAVSNEMKDYVSNPRMILLARVAPEVNNIL